MLVCGCLCLCLCGAYSISFQWTLAQELNQQQKHHQLEQEKVKDKQENNDLTAAIFTNMMMSSSDQNNSTATDRETILHSFQTVLDDSVQGEANSSDKEKQSPDSDSNSDNHNTNTTNSSSTDSDGGSMVDPAANLSVFAMMMEQMQSDFAPFLMLIPKPWKAWIKKTTLRGFEEIKFTLIGAMAPMAITAGKTLQQFSKGIVWMAKALVRLGQEMETQKKERHSSKHDAEIAYSKAATSNVVDESNHLSKSDDSPIVTAVDDERSPQQQSEEEEELGEVIELN